MAYLGHDDLWLPHHLELLVPVIEDGEEAAHTSILMVDPGKAPRAFPGNGWTYAPGAWIPPTSTALARRALVKAGGWRAPSKTLSIEPEADLLVRVSDFGGPPVWIPRLTCVKFSASKRRDVYRTRPHFEQAKWLGTIRQAQNPEEAILATIGTQDVRADEPPPRARLTTRAWRSFRFRLMKRLRLNSAKARNRRTRRFKGL